MMTKGIDPLGCYLKTSIYGIYCYPYIRWLGQISKSLLSRETRFSFFGTHICFHRIFSLQNLPKHMMLHVSSTFMKIVTEICHQKLKRGPFSQLLSYLFRAKAKKLCGSHLPIYIYIQTHTKRECIGNTLSNFLFLFTCSSLPVIHCQHEYKEVERVQC